MIKKFLILICLASINVQASTTLHIYDLHLSKDVKIISVDSSVPLDFILDDLKCYVGRFVNIVVGCDFNGQDVSAELTCSNDLATQTALVFNFNRIYCTEDR